MLSVGTKVRIKKISNPDLTVSMDRIQNNIQEKVATIVEVKDNFYLVSRMEFISTIDKHVHICTPIRFSEVEEINEDQ